MAEEGMGERRPRQTCNTKVSYAELAAARSSGDKNPSPHLRCINYMKMRSARVCKCIWQFWHGHVLYPSVAIPSSNRATCCAPDTLVPKMIAVSSSLLVRRR